MNGPIFSFIALIFSLAAVAAVGLGWWSLRSFNRLRKTFFQGTVTGDMESVINTLVENYNALRQHQAILEETLTKLKSNSRSAIQKTGIVRFNPFADGGGNLSFSLALLNDHNNGLVVTSMHGREQNRIYAKKIQNGRSEATLTEEELHAVELAIAAHQQETLL